MAWVVHYISAVVALDMFVVSRSGCFASRRWPAVARTGNGASGLPDCGVANPRCIVWAGGGEHDRSIFWPESFRSLPSSISWLVKGYAHRTIRRPGSPASRHGRYGPLTALERRA